MKTGDRGDDCAENDGLKQTDKQILVFCKTRCVIQIGIERNVQLGRPDNAAADNAKQIGVDRQNRHHHQQSHQTGHHQKAVGINRHHFERGNLLRDGHGSQLGGNGRPDAGRNDQPGHKGPHFTDHHHRHGGADVDLLPEAAQFQTGLQGENHTGKESDDRDDPETFNTGNIELRGHFPAGSRPPDRTDIEKGRPRHNQGVPHVMTRQQNQPPQPAGRPDGLLPKTNSFPML